MGEIFDSLLGVAADAFVGAVTGEGETVGAQIGKALMEGWRELADDPEDQAWADWVDSFRDEVNADSVYFEVQHKLGHKECILVAVILDEDGNTIDSNSWEVEYDKETKQLHKKIYSLHDENEAEEGEGLLEWVMRFNDNPDAHHTYSEVHHRRGDENCTITVQIQDENNNVIAEEDFEGLYENLKGLHKDVSEFPIGLDNDNEEKTQIEEPVEDRLAKLKKLYDSGILNEDEFNEKKKELIALL